MSHKRNRNKNWARRDRGGKVGTRAQMPHVAPMRNVPKARFERGPDELDQAGAMIVEEELGIPATSLDALRQICRRLPSESSLSFLALLAGRVDTAGGDPIKHLEIAEWFYGSGELVDRYKQLVASSPGRVVFAGQALYSLMRILLDEAYDAPITVDLADEERQGLTAALLACNSITERGIDTNVGALQEDLLAYELQVGHYYHRDPWMEGIARHRELYLLATTDEQLLASPDATPISEWLERSGLDASQQFELGFSLGAISNAWESTAHPYIAPAAFGETLERIGLSADIDACRELISADRAGYLQDFAELAASGKRFILGAAAI
jgi:hypothetical protein